MSKKDFLDAHQAIERDRITPEQKARNKAEYDAKIHKLNQDYNVHISNGGNIQQPTNILNETIIPVTTETDG